MQARVIAFARVRRKKREPRGRGITRHKNAPLCGAYRRESPRPRDRLSAGWRRALVSALTSMPGGAQKKRVFRRASSGHRGQAKTAFATAKGARNATQTYLEAREAPDLPTVHHGQWSAYLSPQGSRLPDLGRRRSSVTVERRRVVRRLSILGCSTIR